MHVDDPQFRIAAARRLLARENCESMVAGHVSQRADDGEDAFWISPFEYFDETVPSRVIKVGFELDIRQGDWEPSPAVQFHAAIYQQRPDVGAIVHTHSQFVSTVVTKQHPIDYYNLVAAMFVERQELYLEDGLQPPVEGKVVASVLADSDAVMLSNHGMIFTAATLEQATIGAILIEQAAQFQVECLRSGGSPMALNGVHRRAEFFREVVVDQMWQAGLRRLQHSDADLFAAA